MDTGLLPFHPFTIYNIKKIFGFYNIREKYEQNLTCDGKKLIYPLPIIGFDCKQLPNGLWDFCLNIADIEWGFISKWPKNS
ncbi:hypothetical protein [Candidatus Albibeggiatoa sp. nov. BB20]|uniref:hypothetical protein n=1 Tax=Candidatus Albibeggiatoa sp. nov. BB20 TaxID=3162723 RepID=UPI0033654951